MVFVIAFILALIVTHTASAETRGDWFKSLRVPGTGISCCDVADCKRVEAVYDHGWFIVVDGKRMAVPQRAIVRDQTSYDGAAYACIVNVNIRCFIPPGGGA